MSEAARSASAGAVFADEFEAGEQIDIRGIRIAILPPRSGRKGTRLAFTGTDVDYTPLQLSGLINRGRLKTLTAGAGKP